MAIGLFYESGGATTQNIHEVSAHMSDRNSSHVAPAPASVTPARPQTIILNDSESEEFEGESEQIFIGSSRVEEEEDDDERIVSISNNTSGSEAEDSVFNCKHSWD